MDRCHPHSPGHGFLLHLRDTAILMLARPITRATLRFICEAASKIDSIGWTGVSDLFVLVDCDWPQAPLGFARDAQSRSADIFIIGTML